MRARYVLALIGLAGVLGAAPALGAEEGKEQRGSVRPGTSQDGSRPNEGAIQGGSIDAKKNADAMAAPNAEIERCRDLGGTLRTQCIEDARKKEAERAAPK